MIKNSGHKLKKVWKKSEIGPFGYSALWNMKLHETDLKKFKINF